MHQRNATPERTPADCSESFGELNLLQKVKASKHPPWQGNDGRGDHEVCHVPRHPHARHVIDEEFRVSHYTTLSQEDRCFDVVDVAVVDVASIAADCARFSLSPRPPIDSTPAQELGLTCKWHADAPPVILTFCPRFLRISVRNKSCLSIKKSFFKLSLVACVVRVPIDLPKIFVGIHQGEVPKSQSHASCLL